VIRNNNEVINCDNHDSGDFGPKGRNIMQNCELSMMVVVVLVMMMMLMMLLLLMMILLKPISPS
jgi:hypothetical protein